MKLNGCLFLIKEFLEKHGKIWEKVSDILKKFNSELIHNKNI